MRCPCCNQSHYNMGKWCSRPSGKCDVAYTIQEFWEILLKTKGGSHAGKKEGSKEGKEKSNEEEGSG